MLTDTIEWMIQQARVCILDECTAAVDLETDAKIQHTIMTQFTGKTLLTIAHRVSRELELAGLLHHLAALTNRRSLHRFELSWPTTVSSYSPQVKSRNSILP